MSQQSKQIQQATQEPLPHQQIRKRGYYMSSNQTNQTNQTNQMIQQLVTLKLKREYERSKKSTQLLLRSLLDRYYGCDKEFEYKSFHYRTFLPPDVEIIVVFNAIEYYPLEYTTEYTKTEAKLILTANCPHAAVIYVTDKTQEVDEEDYTSTATFSSYSDDYGYEEGEKAREYVWHQF